MPRTVARGVRAILASDDITDTAVRCIRELLGDYATDLPIRVIRCSRNAEEPTPTNYPETLDGTTVVLPASFSGRTYATFAFTVPAGRPLPREALEAFAAAAGAALHAETLSADARRSDAVRGALLDASHLVREVSTSPLDDVLSRLVALARTTVASTHAMLHLVDASQRLLYCVASTLLPLSMYSNLPFGRGLGGAVAITAKAVRVDDVYAEAPAAQAVAAPADKKRGSATGPAMAVPVLSPNTQKVIAVIAVSRDRPLPPFTAEDELALGLFAAEVAEVLDAYKRALLYKKVSEPHDGAGGGVTHHTEADASILLDFWRADARKFHFDGSAAVPPSARESRRESSAGSVEVPPGCSAPALHDESDAAIVDFHRPSFSTLSGTLSADAAAKLFAGAARHLGAFDADGGALTSAGAPAAVERFASTVIAAYRPNPYHNWRHALGTTHCTFVLLDRTAASVPPEYVCKLSSFAMLLAALGHDVDHRGRTNGFELSSLSELSLLYNTDAVLEHHHAATLLSMLCQCPQPQHPRAAADVAAPLSTVARPALTSFDPPSQRRVGPGEPTAAADSDTPHSNVLGLSRTGFAQLRLVVVTAILATDMARHAELIERMSQLGPAAAAAAPPAERASFFVHAADLSAPVHPDWAVAYEWSERVNAEFRAQVAEEAAAGLPSAPFMRALDTPAARARQQCLFLDYVIAPLWAAVGSAFPPAAVLAEPLGPHRARLQSIADGSDGCEGGGAVAEEAVGAAASAARGVSSDAVPRA